MHLHVHVQLMLPGQFTQGTTAHQDYPPAQWQQTQQDQHIEACPKPRLQSLPSTCLPYLGSTVRHTNSSAYKVYHSAPNKLQGLLHTHKDKPDPSNRVAVYQIPCECGKVYIAETGRNVPTWLKEHPAHGRRGDFDKSAIVKHSHIKVHQTDWQAAQLITHVNTWHSRCIREAIKILKRNTVPQDIGFYISDIWRPVLRTEWSSISKVHNPPQTEGSPTYM